MTRGPGRTHALREAVKIFLFCPHDFARLWSNDAPRLVSAWRETDASYGVRSCQRR